MRGGLLILFILAAGHSSEVKPNSEDVVPCGEACTETPPLVHVSVSPSVVTPYMKIPPARATASPKEVAEPEVNKLLALNKTEELAVAAVENLHELMVAIEQQAATLAASDADIPDMQNNDKQRPCWYRPFSCPDPCEGAVCKSNPLAHCRANYCGVTCGHREWFLDDKQVTCGMSAIVATLIQIHVAPHCWSCKYCCSLQCPNKRHNHQMSYRDRIATTSKPNTTSFQVRGYAVFERRRKRNHMARHRRHRWRHGIRRSRRYPMFRRFRYRRAASSPAPAQPNGVPSDGKLNFHGQHYAHVSHPHHIQQPHVRATRQPCVGPNCHDGVRSRRQFFCRYSSTLCGTDVTYTRANGWNRRDSGVDDREERAASSRMNRIDCRQDSDCRHGYLCCVGSCVTAALM